MAFGIYIHYPYCLQQCSYCDFATALHTNEEQSSLYLKSLVTEIQQRAAGLAPKKVTSIYFGGGTPSLMPVSDINTIITTLAKQGLVCNSDCEITIEINPDTVDEKKLLSLIQAGVNRFSVGVQTFDDSLLKHVGRKHSAEDTRKTLRLLASNNVNFSVDLLYALPNQTFTGMMHDLHELLSYRPSHFSPYLLTLPSSHFLQKNRPDEEIQVKMLEQIRCTLLEHGFLQYEISNFCLPQKESRHNLNAWKGQPYWGIGMSAHSYLQNDLYGVRFWNPPSVKAYNLQLNERSDFPYSKLPDNQKEFLQKHEALTDFNHTRLRLSEGILWSELLSIFGKDALGLVQSRLRHDKLSDLLIFSDVGVKLSPRGIQLSNIVFSEVVFLKEELA